VGVSGELNRRGIGEELALPRDRALDDPAEEDPHVSNGHERHPNIGSARRAAPPLRFDEAARTVDLKMKYPMSAMTKMPCSRPISRRFRRMSPLSTWLSSWPTTPCSSSRPSCCSVPRVTASTASLGVKPAAKALIAGSWSRT
jgi:hypothetical protein